MLYGTNYTNLLIVWQLLLVLIKVTTGVLIVLGGVSDVECVLGERCMISLYHVS